MPGSIKVSGAQRTVVAPYVKVAGTWRSASIAYVKVAGTWRQWYAANITDNFNRADASSLGTVSNGVTSWTALRGTWAIVSNSAVGTGTYPLATVSNPLQNADYELKLDTSVGTGLAFWVTDANNWWAVTVDTSSSTSYSCPNGGSLSGTSCVSSSTYTASGPYSGGTYTCGTYVPTTSGSYGGVSGTSYTRVSSQCGAQCSNLGYTCLSDGCYRPDSTTICDGNYSRSGSSCSYTIPGYCTQGSYNGSSCVCSYPDYYLCGGVQQSGSTCYTSSSYSATATVTYTYTVKVIQSVAGTVSTLQTYTVPAATASLKVVTANNSVTISSYSGTNQSGTATTNTYTATSPTRTSTAGIIGAGTVDNFGLK